MKDEADTMEASSFRPPRSFRAGTLWSEAYL
jgi:hypothetical protein